VDAPVALAAGPVSPVDTEILDGAGVVTPPEEEPPDDDAEEPYCTQPTTKEPVSAAVGPAPRSPRQAPWRRHRAIPRAAPWALSGAVLSAAIVTASVAAVTAPPDPASVANPVALSVQPGVTPPLASAGSDPPVRRSTAARASLPGAEAGPPGAAPGSPLPTIGVTPVSPVTSTVPVLKAPAVTLATVPAPASVAVPTPVTTSTTVALPGASNGGPVHVNLLTCSHPSGLLQMTGEASNTGASAQRVSISGLFVSSAGTTIGTSQVTVIVPAHASQPWSVTYPDPTASSGRCQMTAVNSAAA